MPITPTYPGIYIQELPSNTHTITAAPTSIAVFVGYSHPFKTKNFETAVQILSFTDYEDAFGGFFSNDIFETAESAQFGSLPHAVNQFFLNGGTNAYIVGLLAQEQASGTTTTPAAIVPATITIGEITFTARELTDIDHMITVTISNAQGDTTSTDATADITIVYGSGKDARVETYRKVSLKEKTNTNRDNPDYILTRIGEMTSTGNTPVVSSLVTVELPSAGNALTKFTNGSVTSTIFAPASGSTIFNVQDFINAFQQDTSLDKLAVFNLLVIPGVTDIGILSEAIAFCERKQAFFIMDPPITAVASSLNITSTTPWIGDYMAGTNNVIAPPKSQNAALYFPYIVSTNPLTGDTLIVPPSGTVAGIYARTDTNRGVWKAPAGQETLVNNVSGLVISGQMNDARQGSLNPLAVNCLRTFPGVGTVVFGARTTVGADIDTAFQQWKYVSVRRMALFIEQTLYHNLGWVIFEPNAEPLWVSIRTGIENFMLALYQQGAFQGTTPSLAFQVKCDSTTTTQTDIDAGIVNIIVAFAPLKPAEFVIVKITQLTAQAQV